MVSLVAAETTDTRVTANCYKAHVCLAKARCSLPSRSVASQLNAGLPLRVWIWFCKAGTGFCDGHFGRSACRAGRRNLVCGLEDTPTETYRHEESTGRSVCATKSKYDRMPWRWLL